MKKTLYILAILAVSIFTACSGDDDHNKEYTLTVASVKPLNIFLPDHEGRPSFFVKNEKEDKWQAYDYINDFEYEEAYEYLIRVKQEKWHNGEIQDASMYKTTLLEVISKTKNDSENIPLQGGDLKIASRKTGEESSPFYVENYSIENGRMWILFPPIKDFEYQEGYEYKIRVIAKYNGANAQPLYDYSLDTEWSKEKFDSVGLPE